MGDDGRLETLAAGGGTSCHNLRSLLSDFPPGLPLVAYSSVSSMSSANMQRLLEWFKNSKCSLLADQRQALDDALAGRPPPSAAVASRCSPWPGPRHQLPVTTTTMTTKCTFPQCRPPASTVQPRSEAAALAVSFAAQAEDLAAASRAGRVRSGH